MTFKVGDKVTTKTYYTEYAIGTIVEIIDNPNIFGGDGSPWCYVSWDKRGNDTYAHKVAGKIYRYVYGFYSTSLKLVEPVSELEDDPKLPTDPRLRGIAIKIRDLENKYKNRHDSAVYQNKEQVLSDFQRSKVCTG
jgi:hypothetical protein